MHEFIAAMRHFRGLIVALAVGILVMQSLVAGLASAATAARLAGIDGGAICHGNGSDDPADAGSNPGQAAHDCCAYCTTAGPAALTPNPAVTGRLEVLQKATAPAAVGHVHISPRAIRAGPSQAPPVVA